MQFSDHGACSLAPHDVAAYMTNIMQRIRHNGIKRLQFLLPESMSQICLDIYVFYSFSGKRNTKNYVHTFIILAITLLSVWSICFFSK
jgi:hypothetical protein